MTRFASPPVVADERAIRRRLAHDQRRVRDLKRRWSTRANRPGFDPRAQRDETLDAIGAAIGRVRGRIKYAQHMLSMPASIRPVYVAAPGRRFEPYRQVARRLVAPARIVRARPRGAGRPAARRTSSGSRTSSTDPGDSDSDSEPPLARLRFAPAGVVA